MIIATFQMPGDFIIDVLMDIENAPVTTSRVFIQE